MSETAFERFCQWWRELFCLHRYERVERDPPLIPHGFDLCRKCNKVLPHPRSAETR